MSGKTQTTEASTASKTPVKPASPQVEGMLDIALPGGTTGVMDRLQADPRALNSREVLQLQRTVGNRSVTQLLIPRGAHGIQTKLTVGAAHDEYEEEADEVAEQVMRMPASAFSPPAGEDDPRDGKQAIRRAVEDKEDIQTKPLAATITPLVQREIESEEEELQTKRQSAADSFEADTAFESRLNTTRGSGSPLPAEVRAFMEPRFDADFSSVRIHTNSEAAQLNREVSAQAFTHGQDIYLGEGKSDLTSSEGKQLLAHELTHVVQQGGAVARKPVVQRALETEPEAAREEAQPLSMEAALAEAQAEVTDADIAQEAVTVDTTPIELPATNEIAGVNVDAGGGAVAAPVAEAEPTAEATPAVAEEPAAAEPVAPTTEVAAATTEPAASTTPTEAVADVTASTVTAQPAAVPTTPAAQVNVPTAEANEPTAEAAAVKPDQAAPAVDATTQLAVPASAKAAIKETQTPAPATETNAPTAETSATQDTAVASATAQPPASTLEGSAPAADAELDDEDKDKLATVRRKAIGSTVQRQVAVAPKTPQEDQAFQQVVVKSKQAAQQEKAHEPATTTSVKAQAASDPKGKDVEMAAQNRQVAEMQAQPAGTFDTAAFKAQLLEKVAETAPKTLKEADEFKNNNKISAVKQSVAGEVKEEKEKAEGPIEEKAEEAPDKSGIPAKDVAALEKTDAGPKPTNPGAKDAAPKARTNAEVATPLQEESATLDKQMSAAHVTEEQLENSNEPEFKGALQSKKGAQKNAVEAPLDYRQGEAATLEQAQNTAQTTSEIKAQETHSEKEQLLAQVFGMQGQTKGVDEGKRQEVANHISDIYLKTKQDVEKVLGDLDGEVNKRFDAGAEEAKRAFEEHVDQRMSKYKWDRYLSIPLIGLGQWVADQFMGLPPEVNVFYVEGRNVYLSRMDSCLTGIAIYIGGQLNRAKQRVAEGKQEIQTYTAGLSPELQQVGREAADKIQGKFNELDESVDSKQSELVDSLAQRYVEKSQELDSRIEEMKQANSGLVNMAAQAIGGVIKTIQDLATMLGNVLQRAANAVSAILKDPIKFLSNLIDGVKQGLQRFVSNIGTHLQTGLIGWLTGALGGVITAFPKSFSDLRGILNMVLEIFGLTYARIRQNVVKGLGERGDEIFGALEKAWEIFQIIRTEGLGGLWEFIKDMVGDLKAMVIDQIQTMIAQEVIQAGIQWVVSLLGGPAGAFIKAAQAIIKIVMWFVNNGSKLLALVNSVIDSIAAIAAGNVSAAAQYIENSLAKAVPLLIGFLADLLGLGGIAKKVQNIIAKIRAPIDKAIQWVVKKAVALGKKLLAKLRFGKKGETEGEASNPEVQKRWDDGMLALGQLKEKSKQDPLSQEEINTELTGIKSKYQFKELTAKHEGEDWQVYADMNPKTTLTGFEGEGDIDEANIKKAVAAAGGVIQFMKAMAAGQTIEGIDRSKLEKAWGENQKIKDWLKDKFRDANPGNHEWIPSNMIMDVINRATNVAWGVEVANWIDLHHELRTDTSWVIFSPDYSPKRIKGQVVLQGHPGAIYIRTTNSEGAEYLQPQTAGVNKWHDSLRSKFTNNTTAVNVLGSLRTFFGYTVWDGKSLPGNLHPEHRDSSGQLLDMNALKGQQQANFDKTQDMFSNLMTKYS